MSLSQPTSHYPVVTTRDRHQMNVFVWNIQGAGSGETLNILREHIRMHRPSIVALVETRISRRRAQAVCDKIGFRNCFRVEAQGFQGGIWVLWNSDEIGVAVRNSHEQFVTVEVQPHDRMSWLLTIVYASPHTQHRDILWQKLQQFASVHDKPWLLAGDFNETISLEERNHGVPEMLRRCKRFKHWIENTGLIDLGFSGPNFTWARGMSSATRKEARLDRALYNIEWRRRFQDGCVRHLLQAGSDHSPLLIVTGGFALAKLPNKPFWFLAAWATHDQFETVVKENWDPSFSLMSKLDKLATSLTTWNKEVFGNLFRRKRNLWARLERIQRRLTTGASCYLLKLERRLRHQLDHTLDQIALLCFQKARVDQIQDGDRNTRHFHLSTIIRRRFNHINALKNKDDEWCFDPRKSSSFLLTISVSYSQRRRP